MNNRGFTLIELLVVISLIGIVAAFAAPMFTDLIESSRLTTNANSLIESISVARSEAVRQNVQTEVVANGGNWKSGWIVKTIDNQKECPAAPPCDEADKINVDKGKTISAFESEFAQGSISTDPANTKKIEFAPNGLRLTTQQVKVKICGPSKKGREIKIGPTGSTGVTKIDSGCT